MLPHFIWYMRSTFNPFSWPTTTTSFPYSRGPWRICAYLGREAYPMVREQVIDLLIDRHAPAKIVDLTRTLPSGREFHNVNEIWAAVGGRVESERF